MEQNNKQTDDKIMSWKEMIQVERGADITEMEAPIPSTIGEGFTFCVNGKQYTTIGGYTKGKRDVEFYITSYIGYCGGAEHYYCSISIPVENRNGNTTIGGYHGGIEIPNEYQSFKASKGLERTGRKRDVQPKERSTSPEWTDRLSRLQRHDADTISERLEGMHQSWGEESQRQCLWRDLARHCEEGNWRQFPTQSPVCRGNDGIPFDVDSLTISFPKWRQESIKAYGNAWVPQVAYEIFRAIEAEEENNK